MNTDAMEKKAITQAIQYARKHADERWLAACTPERLDALETVIVHAEGSCRHQSIDIAQELLADLRRIRAAATSEESK